MSKVFISIFLGMYSLLLLPSLAHAYLDPGNGSMLLQLLLGGAAGLSVIIKLYWRRFLSAIGIAKREESASSDERAQPDAAPEQRANQP